MPWKVVEAFNGQWSCEKCNAEFPTCTRRYMLYASMSDHTSDTGFTLFNDTAEQLLGRTADEMYEMKQSGDEAGYEAVFQAAIFTQVLVKARVKQVCIYRLLSVVCDISVHLSASYNTS